MFLIPSKRQWHRWSLPSKITFVSFLIGVLGFFVAIKSCYSEKPKYDLTGEWELTNKIDHASYLDYINMELKFRMFLTQNGTLITGEAEKFSVNGEELPFEKRTPISIQGNMDAGILSAKFIESGELRKTIGLFRWNIEKNGNVLSGTFESSASSSKGSSSAIKIK